MVRLSSQLCGKRKSEDRHGPGLPGHNPETISKQPAQKRAGRVAQMTGAQLGRMSP
jgi:hypothetical protein